MKLPIEPMHILLVEDDEDHAEFIKRILQRADPDITLIRVKDGAEAVSFILQRPPYQNRSLPALVILDLKLPKKSGHEVLEEIKAHSTYKSIPFVVLTTSDAEVDKERAYSHHVNSYLVKPMEAEQFKRMLRELHLYWINMNRPVSSLKAEDDYDISDELSMRGTL